MEEFTLQLVVMALKIYLRDIQLLYNFNNLKHKTVTLWDFLLLRNILGRSLPN